MKVIDNRNVLGIIRSTLSMVDCRLIDHGERVGYILFKMLKCEGSYSRKEIIQRYMLGVLHDIGAYKTDEINNMLRFETANVWDHSMYGYLFISSFSPMHGIADAVLFHHLAYSCFEHVDCKNQDLAQMLCIADRIDIYLQARKKKSDRLSFERFRGKRFNQAYVDLFVRADEQEHIVKKLEDGSYHDELAELADEMQFSIDEINGYLKMLVYSIDFRSEHTVTHTITTTNISREIAKLMELTQEKINKIYYGAMLHDLGKISIPIDILESPGKLNDQEMKIMKTHVEITREIIKGYIDPEICEIAIRHHEKLDGMGYPCGLKGDVLTVEQRIVAVADVMSALSGKRSYKERYTKEKIFDILQRMVAGNKICGNVVAVVIKNYDAIDENVTRSCEKALKDYQNIFGEYMRLSQKYGRLETDNT